MDRLGQIIWFASFIVPLAAFPLTWRLKEAKKGWRIVLGVLLAAVTWFLLHFIGLALVFYDVQGL